MSATFVLVHGAWLGGWCWKKVTPLLRAAGHEVFAPTLTGLGERFKPLDLRTAFGVSSEPDIAWAAPRLSDHPARADSQPVDLSRTVNLRQTYIRCSNNFPFFEESAERAKRQGFRFYELMSANHCPMVTQPDDLVKILLALV
jgi:hypothetical protein